MTWWVLGKPPLFINRRCSHLAKNTKSKFGWINTDLRRQFAFPYALNFIKNDILSSCSGTRKLWLAQIWGQNSGKLLEIKLGYHVLCVEVAHYSIKIQTAYLTLIQGKFRNQTKCDSTSHLSSVEMLAGRSLWNRLMHPTQAWNSKVGYEQSHLFCLSETQRSIWGPWELALGQHEWWACLLAL